MGLNVKLYEIKVNRNSYLLPNLAVVGNFPTSAVGCYARGGNSAFCVENVYHIYLLNINLKNI